MKFSLESGIQRLPLGETIPNDISVGNYMDELCIKSAETIRASGNPADYYIRLHLLKTYVEKLMTDIKPDVVEDLRNNPRMSAAVGITITPSRTYDYSADDDWQTASAHEQKYAELRKGIEESMKKSGSAKILKESYSPKVTIAGKTKAAGI